MNIISKILPSIVAVVLVASCSNMHDEQLVQQDREQEVELAIPVASTRTMIGDDGRTTNWIVGDKIALWAEESDNAGNFVVENAAFTLRHFSPTYDKAVFTARIADLTPVDNYEMQRYNYYLCSPMPNSVNGTEVTYNLPAVQSGKYESGYDIMVARPVEEEWSLTYFGQTELNTSFMHQMHALKITVPNGDNLDGNRIHSITMTFPVPVAGDITFDITDPDATPLYTNTSNTITVNSDAGFNIGETIWVFVLPGSVTSADNVSYYMRGERRRSNEVSYQRDINMTRGYVTPITMSVPEIYPYYTAVHFSIDQNYLGEDFNYFDIYSPGGTHMGTFQRNSDNKYTVDYEGEFDMNQYDNSEWRVVFDSEHAVVETTINLGDVTAYTEHTRWMNVPYLYSENFSTIQSYSNNDNTGAQSTNVTAADLSSYGLMSGWSGARTGGEAGQSIRVGARVDRVWGYTHTYGRLDSPAISAIKDGVNVNVHVSFSYSGGRNGDSGYSPRAVCGYTTQGGLIDGKTGSFSSDEDGWENMSDHILIPSISTSGSYSNVSQSMSYEIERCDNTCRLSWMVRGTGEGGFISNGNQWLYIDNIRVTIVP